MSTEAIVADIGGTNARFGLVNQNGEIDHVSVLQCADFRGIDEAFHHFSSEVGRATSQLAVAVACPVQHDSVKLTNNDWSFSKKALVNVLNLSELLVINDFTAQSLAAVSVNQDAFEVIQAGSQDPFGPMFVIGPGTGLGVGGLVVDAQGEWTPLSTEGGHVTMAAQTEDEWRLLTMLRKEYSHVSAERLISGPGLLLIYRSLCALEGLKPLVNSPQALIHSYEDDAIVRRTLELFAGFFGIVASDGCLTLGATGGCCIAGGVIPKLGDYFRRDIFLERFRAKGRFKNYLSNIPIKILLDSEAGLYGLKRALATNALDRYVVRP